LRRVFNPKLETTPNKLSTLKIQDKFSRDESADHAIKGIKSELNQHRYRIKEKSGKDFSFLLARKKTSGLFGSDIVHLGLLIILAGGIFSGMAGLKSHLSFSEGEILSVPNADFELRLDKFETEFYENGQVSDWKSTLTVIENGNDLQTKIVEVNHPLSYKGYMFYQSSYGWDWQRPTLEIWAKSADSGDYIGSARLRLGERIPLEGSDLQITALQFVPDFIINENNTIATRSMQPNNPAVYIEGWQGETQVFSGWIFAKFPEFSRMHSEEETNLSFELRDFQGGQISVIQAAKDPGVDLIWIGCTVLMLGLGMAFYWPPREIKVIIEPSPNKTEIYAGGIASKNKDAFQIEFNNLMTTLRRDK